jgi:hypothetical protein
MKYSLVLLLFLSSSSFAAGFHYCNGKIIDLVTRASSEGTSVRIEGMNGFATVGFGGDAQSKMHDRQFSMLIAAYMAGKEVTLEFVDNTKTCTDDHNNVQLRYVRFR